MLHPRFILPNGLIVRSYAKYKCNLTVENSQLQDEQKHHNEMARFVCLYDLTDKEDNVEL